MSSTIQKALYKQKHGASLTRREAKALKQHAAAPDKRTGFCSYKANRSRVILDFGIDIQADLLIPTKTMPYNDYIKLSPEQQAQLKSSDRRSWLDDALAEYE